MAGTSGGKVCDSSVSHPQELTEKFPQIREHFQKNIGDVYKGLDLEFTGFPRGAERNPEACVSCNTLP